MFKEIMSVLFVTFSLNQHNLKSLRICSCKTNYMTYVISIVDTSFIIRGQNTQIKYFIVKNKLKKFYSNVKIFLIQISQIQGHQI